MDRLTAIKVFIEVAEKGSFSAAADKLDLSRPMVTRYINMMETWLNARLLQRTTRQLSLTHAGNKALYLCRKIIELSELLEAESCQISHELQGTIKITCGYSFGNHHLVPAISAFQEIHPNLKIRLYLSDENISLVSQGIDLAIRITANPDLGLHARALANCRSDLLASPQYLAKYGVPESPEALLQHRCLLHEVINPHSWKFSKNQQIKELDIEAILVVNEVTALMEAAKLGNGIAMLPRFLSADLVAQNHLIPILSDWQLPKFTIYALYPSKEKLPRSVRLLLDFLAKRFENMNW